MFLFSLTGGGACTEVCFVDRHQHSNKFTEMLAVMSKNVFSRGIIISKMITEESLIIVSSEIQGRVNIPDSFKEQEQKGIGCLGLVFCNQSFGLTV